MLSQLTQTFPPWSRRHLAVFVQLVLMLWFAPTSMAQGLGISGANVGGVCPAACGIKIRITSALLRETPNGIDAVIDWTFEQTAPEIKLSNFNVTAVVEFKSRSRDETTISVSGAQRQAVVRLTQSGKNKDIKFSDVTSVRAIVTAVANALPLIPVTNIPSRKITGQGGDSAVEVTWVPPTPLPCSAGGFEINVAAINEKGDRLTGNTGTTLTARKSSVELKGAVNKKGLRNPEATVQVFNNPIECQQTTNFPPKQEGFSAGTGSTGASSAKVTLSNLSLRAESPERVSATINWEVVEPTSFKVTGFVLKLEEEDATGKTTASSLNFNGNQRSFEAGGIASPGNIRSLTATITATFKDNANTTVLTREDKKTQPFSLKQTVKPAVDISPAVPKPIVPKPVAPQPQDIRLELTNVKVSSASNLHRVAAVWQVNVPSSITITSFEVEVQVAGNKTKANRSAVVLGKERQATVNFTFDEVGNQVSKAQVKVIANVRRADGSTFQQTATRNSN